jgi:hypothetical protein
VPPLELRTLLLTVAVAPLTWMPNANTAPPEAR